jgi:membrane protein DedA with SNARE-associated domain
MFDQIVGAIAEYPYVGVALVFLLCGLGFPLPEEIVLLAAGYVCARFPEQATLPLMMAWCAGAILVGDLLPYVGGRVFGVRLLRLRWLRYFVTKQRLASFDRWFRQRGDLVIVISRFLAGLRVVAFFTAGALKMPWRRFLFLDGLGIALMVPSLIWLGYHSAAFIETVHATVLKVERGILWGALGVGALLAIWIWLWRRRRRMAHERLPTETFIQPQRPVQEPEPAAPCPPNDADAAAPPDPDAPAAPPTAPAGGEEPSAPN